MPNEKAAEPLSEEKLAEFERHIRNEDCVCDYEADALALLAEVRLGREALKALDNLLTATTTNAGADATCCAVIAAKTILRKAGRR